MYNTKMFTLILFLFGKGGFRQEEEEKERKSGKFYSKIID